MDFNLKQWRDESEHETSAKLPKLNSSSSPLPLFVPLSSTATKLPTPAGMGGGTYFSSAQWQELELQALIFRHIMGGAAVPPELLHLVKKSLVGSPAYYLCNPLHYYHPSSLGYWGKAAMDPEPGRCRRTDGKKWRCSRDVVAAQKYCERHMHRGKNRSRKPVEIPTATAPRFSLSGPLTYVDLHHHNHNPRPMESIPETKCPSQPQNDAGDPTLRHFFHDWPRSLDQAADDAATNLSISTSDFSLKLGSGSGDGGEGSRSQMNWGMAWEAAHRSAPMGGPLAEALRSSLSTSSSPTSVLHRLQRTSASHTSFVTS
ncbi:growth-regulating factor 3-like isoform X2 [Salvia miltiorrhiza]|uniref:growth-regulating factor 3-like isoform X2 n=1 Tax=Salvia miltiorrhiza TaxID=226208 RepID=UPI0025AD4C7E|nr:growth-regulating factor 3-like isoform X2 [Salvia miltiorrhiza]XP_057779346.1 growth-regulating factor 3-like isoform X2 [Salvia miltiorrhiza]